MPDGAALTLFLAAALIVAITPGPGIFYVAARTLAGGQGEGLASTAGTGLGGLVHVAAGAVGVSAIVLASAELFQLLKLAGAVYLVYLGIRAVREAGAASMPVTAAATGARRAFREGVVVEALNPKTAAFFLAFIPQFIAPDGSVLLQFLALGLASVLLNTLADVVVVRLAASLRTGAARHATLIRRLRQGSGVVLCGLGLSLAFARRPD